jgi:CubicO group peptidase (beta-lactamase class C family)
MMTAKISLIILLANIAIHVHSQPAYDKDIDTKIKLVENNLVSWVKFDGAHSNIYDRMKDLKINGVSIAVINNYKIDWAKSYGWADTALKKPVDNNTLFQIASIGKSLNAFGQMSLVQNGKMLLDEDINHYLVRWKFPYASVSKGKKITLANLLSHTAGLSVHGFDGYEWNEQLPTIIQTLNGENPANNPPVRSEFEPGIKSEYSGGGIMISQVMLEDVTKMKYDDYMKKTIFIPLGMTHTSFSTDPPNENFATGYRFDGKYITGRYMRFTEQACGGAAWSTASDLAKFIIEVQLSLKNQSNKVLKKETIQKMLTPYLEGTNSAFGFFIDDKKGDLYFQHSGLNPGYSSQFYGSMEGGRGVVVLVNSDITDFMAEVVNSVAAVYGWKNFNEYTTKKVIAVPPDTLKKYAGSYKFEGSETGPNIQYDNGQLYLIDPHSPIKWKLYFTSNDEFFMIEARWADQKFFFANQNRVAGFTITTGTYHSKVIKIE